MAPAVGVSFLFPAVPILCIFSNILLLVLIPGFWKTGVFALLALVGWLIIGNMLVLIGMIGWRGNMHDAPIFADIISALWYCWFFGAFCSLAAFSKFVWQRLQPSSARMLYDQRRRNNIIDACLTILLPLLWVPTFLASCSGRYFIVEDIGPMGATWNDWPGFFVTTAPMITPTAAMAIFNVLAVFSYWRLKPSDHTSKNSRRRSRKLLIMSLCNLVLALFAISYTVGKLLQYSPVSSWVPPLPLSESIEYLKVVRFMDRYFMEKVAPETLDAATSRCISMPLLGFYLFAWFGFSAEARKSYREAFKELSCIFITEPNPSQLESEKPASRWPRILAKFAPCRKSNNILPNTRDITPFVWSPSTGSGESLPSKPEEAHCSEESEEVMEITLEKRRHSPQVVSRRVSFHKPPLSPSVPVNPSTLPAVVTLDMARRLSFRKPPPPLSLNTLPVAAAGEMTPQADSPIQNEEHTHEMTLHLPIPLHAPSRPPPTPPIVHSSMPPTYRVWYSVFHGHD